MEPTMNELYERYLTAYSCAATGAMAHPAPNNAYPHDTAVVLEAAQACGTADGWKCRSSGGQHPALSKSALRQRLDGMLGTECTSHGRIPTPAGDVVISLEAPSGVALASILEEMWGKTMEQLLTRFANAETED